MTASQLRQAFGWAMPASGEFGAGVISMASALNVARAACAPVVVAGLLAL